MPHSNIEVPERIPLHVQKEMVVFPYMIFPLYVSERELKAFNQAEQYDRLVAVALRRSDDAADRPGEVSQIGTLCRVTQVKRMGDGKHKVSLEGLHRLRIIETETTPECTMVRCEPVREFVEKNLVSEALVQSMNALLKISLSHGKPLPDDVMKMIDYIDNPARLSDLVALYVNLPLTDLQELLETVDPLERLKKVYVHLTNEVQRMQVKNEVASEVNKRVGKNQKGTQSHRRSHRLHRPRRSP